MSDTIEHPCSWRIIKDSTYAAQFFEAHPEMREKFEDLALHLANTEAFQEAGNYVSHIPILVDGKFVEQEKPLKTYAGASAWLEQRPNFKKHLDGQLLHWIDSQHEIED